MARIEAYYLIESGYHLAEAATAIAGEQSSGTFLPVARITISWPLANIGAHLSNVMATVAGNLFELRQVSGLRLLDLRLPVDFAATCPSLGFAWRARGR